MKYILKIIIFILLVTFPDSCYYYERLNFDLGIIPETPVNFNRVNSTWDDYNSNFIPTSTYESSFTLIFSTNRNSYGDNFDFIIYECDPEFDLIHGGLKMNIYSSHEFLEDDRLFDSVNSPYNELGPYFTHDLISYFSGLPDYSERFFYTSDKNGNLDIFCIYYTDSPSHYLPAGSSFNVSGINTDSDEGYLTIHQDENPDRETVYFTSDRDGNFDIYRAVSEENKLIDQSAVPQVTRVGQLSSNAEDKCPFIINDIMVFASDRAGGFGGYDLWYSIYQDNEWSTPVNFGEEINTEYDEFRPVIAETNPDEFFSNFMIFSSNRPGGQGGFDLYYVGVKK